MRADLKQILLTGLLGLLFVLGGCPQSTQTGNALDRPTAVGPSSIETDEDESASPVELTGSSEDAPEEDLTVSITKVPLHGTLSALTGSAPLEIVYTPDENYFGTDSLEFAVSDIALKTSVPVTVPITVHPVQDPPTLEAIPNQIAQAGEPFSFMPMAEDVDGDTLLFALTGAALPAWADFDAATGTISGTPGGSDLGVTPGVVVTVTDEGVPPVTVESSAFNLIVEAGPATQLVLLSAPDASQILNVPWDDGGGAPIEVVVADMFGNRVERDDETLVAVVLGLATGVLSGTTQRTVADGIAVFDDLVYDTHETVSVSFSVDGLFSPAPIFVTVTPGPAVGMSFELPPSPEANVSFPWPAFVVRLEDAYGNLATTSGDTLEIAVMGEGPELVGTTSLASSSGRVVFEDLRTADEGTVAFEIHSLVLGLPSLTELEVVVGSSDTVIATIGWPQNEIVEDPEEPGRMILLPIVTAGVGPSFLGELTGLPTSAPQSVARVMIFTDTEPYDPYAPEDVYVVLDTGYSFDPLSSGLDTDLDVGSDTFGSSGNDGLSFSNVFVENGGAENGCAAGAGVANLPLGALHAGIPAGVRYHFDCVGAVIFRNASDNRNWVSAGNLPSGGSGLVSYRVVFLDASGNLLSFAKSHTRRAASGDPLEALFGDYPLNVINDVLVEGE